MWLEIDSYPIVWTRDTLNRDILGKYDWFVEHWQAWNDDRWNVSVAHTSFLSIGFTSK